MRRPKISPGARSAIGVGIVFVALSFAHPPAVHAETPTQFIMSLGNSAIFSTAAATRCTSCPQLHSNR